jgi:casein kinase 1
MSSSAPSKLCGGRFQVTDQLGEGCFGAVYRGTDRSNNRDVAIKIEFPDCAAGGSLANEYSMLSKLSHPEPQQGFAEAYWFGHSRGHACLVMDLLGQSLEDTVEGQNGKLPASAVALVAIQALMRIEYLHSRGIVHRDIKPENFMWGIKDRVHHLYLIDFGMGTKYWDREHLKERREASLVGTARYASINAHDLKTQSRRDDLEAIGHMFFYMLRGVLPWSGLKARTDEEKYRKIGEKKKTFPLNELCKGHPQEFATYLEYCRGLPWQERPDYERLQQLMRKVRKQAGDPADHQLPWLGKDVDVSALSPIRPWHGLQQPDDLPSPFRLGPATKCWYMPKVPFLGRNRTTRRSGRSQVSERRSRGMSGYGAGISVMSRRKDVAIATE